LKSFLPALPEGWETLAAEAIKGGIKISKNMILRIWRSTPERIPGLTAGITWIEIGYQKNIDNKQKGVGFLHMLTHKVEFEQLGIPPHQLLELAEARRNPSPSSWPTCLTPLPTMAPHR
jgi:hypothetical protein